MQAVKPARKVQPKGDLGKGIFDAIANTCLFLLALNSLASLCRAIRLLLWQYGDRCFVDDVNGVRP
jgi:hypothetical protein